MSEAGGGGGPAPAPAAAASARRGTLTRELLTLLRASASSIAATVVDAVIYQAILLLGLGGYTLAAFSGAVVGGVTNFTLNRTWAFPPSGRSLKRQVLMYAVASGLVYLALQGSLMLLIEVLHVDEHLAWFPAQLVAWAVVSYPLFRYVVFAGPRRGQG